MPCDGGWVLARSIGDALENLFGLGVNDKQAGLFLRLIILAETSRQDHVESLNYLEPLNCVARQAQLHGVIEASAESWARDLTH